MNAVRERPTRRLAALALLPLAGALALAGCGRASPGSPPPTTTTVTTTGTATAPSGPVTTTTTTAPATGTVAGRWVTLPPAPVPALVSPVGVWTGREFVLVGEAMPVTGDQATGYAVAWSPTTNSWRTLPTPSGSRRVVEGAPQAVWTGTEVIVWGGNFFEAYEPATNTWRHLGVPADGAPGGGGFAMVWTGRYVILYGGGCCGGPEDGAAAYEPSTGRWTRLEGALGARWTSGAWTGTEVVIAGGNGPLVPSSTEILDLSSAAAWNPSTGYWRRLPDLPAPTRGPAVWDGREVVVLGAHPAAYRPDTNTWTALTAGWDGRRSAAIVAGRGMALVWGGTLPTTKITEEFPPHGLAYDPAAGRWRALPMSPLRGRGSPIAVWTGTSMIVWGGANSTTGAVFTPTGA